MATQVIPKLLSKLSITCDAVSELADETHREAFVALFDEVLTLLRPLIENSSRISRSARQPLLFRRDTQSAWMQVSDFWQNTEKVACEIYLEDATEHVLRFEGKQTWVLLVGSDPVLFELTVADPSQSPPLESPRL